MKNKDIQKMTINEFMDYTSGYKATPYTLGFCFNEKKDKVVLIKKRRPDWQKGLLNGIGGKINPNENDHEAQVREFFEETAIDIDSNDLKFI